MLFYPRLLESRSKSSHIIQIFDRYTIWDLMLEKVRSNSRNAEFGALPLLIDDCERILLELRNLVELCMDYSKLRAILQVFNTVF